MGTATHQLPTTAIWNRCWDSMMLLLLINILYILPSNKWYIPGVLRGKQCLAIFVHIAYPITKIIFQLRDWLRHASAADLWSPEAGHNELNVVCSEQGIMFERWLQGTSALLLLLPWLTADTTDIHLARNWNHFVKLRQGWAKDGPLGKRCQSLKPCRELTLKLVATHHPPNHHQHHHKFNFIWLMARWGSGGVSWGKGRCVGSLWVTLG